MEPVNLLYGCEEGGGARERLNTLTGWIAGCGSVGAGVVLLWVTASHVGARVGVERGWSWPVVGAVLFGVAVLACAVTGVAAATRSVTDWDPSECSFVATLKAMTVMSALVVAVPVATFWACRVWVG
jgi:uncharacterized membrane protein